MNTRRVRENAKDRLDMGAAVLAAARVLDVELVKARLSAFANAQRRYTEAQRQIEAAKASLREGRVRLALRNAQQDRALEGLARALVADGQLRVNPFAAFGMRAPSLIKHMRPGTKAKAIHQLVAAVQRNTIVPTASLHTAQIVEATAQTVEATLLAVDKLQNTLRDARHRRDEVAHTWDTALAALKRGAQAAADDGALGLYTALFRHQSRANNKTAKPAAVAAPEVAQQAAA